MLVRLVASLRKCDVVRPDWYHSLNQLPLVFSNSDGHQNSQYFCVESSSLERFLTMKNKLIAGLAALLFVFCAGFYVGHWTVPPSNVDPQKYLTTVFTPFEDGTKAYVDWLDEHGRNSLYVADYTFNNPVIIDKYVELKIKHKSDVHVLLDLSESRAVAAEQPAIDKLRAAGIEVVVGTSPQSGAIMHNKFSIADGVWVEDGSWNYSDAADKQGNTLNFTKVPSPERGAMFKGSWDKLHTFMVAQTDRRDEKAKRQAEKAQQSGSADDDSSRKRRRSR